jgi:hypothetical protein
MLVVSTSFAKKTTSYYDMPDVMNKHLQRTNEQQMNSLPTPPSRLNRVYFASENEEYFVPMRVIADCLGKEREPVEVDLFRLLLF